MASAPMTMRHVPQLDGVRAIAVLIVMIAHAGLGQVIPGGFGVTIFFFLSGYLITSLLRTEFQATGRIDIRQFYLRRVARIFPPLYITVLLTCVAIAAGFFKGRVQAEAIIWDFLFLTNYAHLFGPEGGVPIPLWSLAVEEHFYLAFPVLFAMFLAGRAGRKAAAWCTVACVVALALRFATLIDPEELWRNYYWSHTRIDSILFGSILALWNNPRLDPNAWKPRFIHAALAIGLIGFTVVYRDPLFRETIRYTLQGAALFVLFSYVLSDRSAVVTAFLSSAAMKWVGLLSYTLYLCHFPIYLMMAEAFDLSEFAAGTAGLPLAFLYSWLMYIWVERPVGEWRRRLQSRPAPVVIA